MADFVEMCERGEVEGVRETLGRGVNVNTRGRWNHTGLMVAAVGDQEEVHTGWTLLLFKIISNVHIFYLRTPCKFLRE